MFGTQSVERNPADMLDPFASGGSARLSQPPEPNILLAIARLYAKWHKLSIE